MASPEAAALIDILRDFREAVVGQGAGSLEDIRAAMALMAGAATEPDGVTVSETYAGGVRAYWNDPPDGAMDACVLYLHGGGYVIGSPATHERFVGHMAKAVGCRYLSVDYRLAPEHPHPAAVEDSVAAYSWLLAQGYVPERIAISGDSAGGGLTLATLLALRERGLPQPAGAVPMSPWTDLEGTGESMSSRADRDMIVGFDGLKLMADHFLAGGDPRHPLASPLHADYTGIAPIYFQVGDDETLLDDSTRAAEKARAAGVDVTIDVFPEMQHVFQSNAGNVPEADDAVARIGAWLRPRLGL